MKYFVTIQERKGSCYHEFYRGRWDEATFWKDDSLLLHDDILSMNSGFIRAVMQVIPNYAQYGITEISAAAWKEIGKIISKEDSSARELYEEASVWVKEVFASEDCFTILGI